MCRTGNPNSIYSYVFGNTLREHIANEKSHHTLAFGNANNIARNELLPNGTETILFSACSTLAMTYENEDLVIKPSSTLIISVERSDRRTSIRFNWQSAIYSGGISKGNLFMDRLLIDLEFSNSL